MNNCLNGGTHGPVHILIGGEWADPEREFIVKTGGSCSICKELFTSVNVYLNLRVGFTRDL